MEQKLSYFQKNKETILAKRKLRREFEERASFPRHQYNMKHVFVDIRDHLTYNY